PQPVTPRSSGYDDDPHASTRYAGPRTSSSMGHWDIKPANPTRRTFLDQIPNLRDLSTAYQENSTLDATGNHLLVRAPHGISITPSLDGKVHVRMSVEYGLGRPDITPPRSTPDGVILEADCHGWMTISSCSVAYEVQVPPAFNVEAISQTGTLSATGLAGNARLTTSAGDIRVSRMGGDL